MIQFSTVSDFVFLCIFSMFVTLLRSPVSATTLGNDNTGCNGVSPGYGSEMGNTTLELVQVLFRHGDRSPILTYPKDQYQTSQWKYGWGALTDIGAQQAFDLGRFLRDHYLELSLGNITDDQIFVRSSSFPRAVMTANCVLAGILKPDAVTSFDPRKETQPITVHQEPKDEDQLLSLAACPHYERLKKTWMETSSLYANFTKKYQVLFDYLSKHMGRDVNGTSVVAFADAVFCETRHNLTMPHWLSAKNVSQLFNIYNETTSFVTPTREMQKLLAGALLEKMLQSIHEKMVHVKSRMKLYVYSAHDTNVLSLLSALGVFNDLHPPYVSCVMVELHRKDRMYYVRVFYRNDTCPKPRLLKIPGCEEFCHIATLHKLTQNVTMKVEDRAAVCGPVWGSTKVQQNVVPIVIGGVLLLAVIVAGAVWFVHRRRKRSTKVVNYRQLLQDSESNLLDSDDDELL